MIINIDRNAKHHDFVYPAADTLPARLRAHSYMYAGRRDDGAAVLLPEASYIPSVLRGTP
jgi:hypothetical protein